MATKTKSKPSSKPEDISIVDDMFEGDAELAVFFTAWLENGRNATKAYQVVRPESPYFSAAVLGHRMLKKVNKDAIFEQYNLNMPRYLGKIDEGLDAKKFDKDAGMVEDRPTQIHYHTKMGEILGIAKEEQSGMVNNYFQFIANQKNEFS